MSRTDKGLVTDHIWQIDLGFDATYNTDCTPFIEALKQNSAIDDVTALTQPLLVLRGEWYCSFITQFPIEGRNNVDEATEDNCIVVQKNFLSFFGMKMKEGEWIQDQGTRDIVINETGARELNIPSLTGRLILSDDEDSENHAVPTRISGILRDFYYCPMQYPLSKVFFMYQNNADAARGYHGFRYFYIKVHPDNEKQALQYARRIYSQYSKKRNLRGYADHSTFHLNGTVQSSGKDDVPYLPVVGSTLYPDFFFSVFSSWYRSLPNSVKKK